MANILVIGGGAAGLMAAITAARTGAQVVVVERNQKVGRKLYITGKGRCNLTNNVPVDEVLSHYPRGGRFLYSAMSRFTPEDTMAFFSQLGVALKTERGNRVFPVSDCASDVVDSLFYELRRLGIVLVQGRVRELTQNEKCVTGVVLDNGRKYSADAVVVCTGGVSYPSTGSTGDGYHLARAAGHTVLPVRGSLVPLVERGNDCARMQGLALKNVGLKIRDKRGKTAFKGFGEILFTHFGLSGPVILSASAHLEDFDKRQYSAIIDLKPALDEKMLDSRMLRDFANAPNRTIQTVLGGLLPRLMIPVLLRRGEISPQTKVHTLTKEQRRTLLELMKGFCVDLEGLRPVEEAIVTVGGVALKEIDPGTMESKRLSRLYFAGEVLDIDGYTGGFNLQAAWATGHAAGRAAAQAIKEKIV